LEDDRGGDFGAEGIAATGSSLRSGNCDHTISSPATTTPTEIYPDETRGHWKSLKALGRSLARGATFSLASGRARAAAPGVASGRGRGWA
jgi:hypothetical protein